MINHLISVIMPVYNVELYLPRAIESVLNQTHKNIELLLIDDGSTDHSGLICDEYAIKDDRVRVFHKENSGQAEARNVGLDNASGDWIAFLDSDDWIEPNMYELLLQIAIDNNALISACRTQYTYGDDHIEPNDTNIINDYSVKEILKMLLNDNVIRFELWNKLWSYKAIGNTRFKKGQIGEEVYFDFEAFKRIDKITYVDSSLHHYLVSRDGNTKSKFRMERMCIFDEFESYRQYLMENLLDEEAGIVACIASMFCISVYLEAVEKEQSKELQSKLRSLFFRFAEKAGSARNLKLRAIILFTISPSLYAYLLNRRLDKQRNSGNCIGY